VPPRDHRAGLRICSAANDRPDFGRFDQTSRKLLEMPLPTLAKNPSDRDVQPILFGLLADGSGEARFAGTPFALVGPSSEAARFSPSRDWYGRWAVQPLHGSLQRDATRMDRGVCPEDIVILGPRRHTRRS